MAGVQSSLGVQLSDGHVPARPIGSPEPDTFRPCGDREAELRDMRGTGCLPRCDGVLDRIPQPEPGERTGRGRRREATQQAIARYGRVDRLQEAKDQGWLGEVAAIETTMAAAAQKLEAMRDRAAQPSTVHLGMPDFRRDAGRSSAEFKD